MTLDEGFAQGFTSFRLANWAIPQDHIELTVFDGRLGPWVHLHSPLTDKPTAISIMEVDQMTNWEPYTLPASPDEGTPTCETCGKEAEADAVWGIRFCGSCVPF